MYIELIGFMAAILTTAAFVPQAYKIWKTKSADGVSLSMILANFITASLLIMIIYFKIRHK